MSAIRISHKAHKLEHKSQMRRTALSVAIAAAIASPVYAQDEQDEVALEEIVVTGVRQSLSDARAIKRDAETFVDAISATDIGALPDVSVLEALQRVPGVAIERFAAPDDPDHFSTEGSGATLRGLPQTRSSFNGRDTFSANSSRGLSFQDVPPELMGSVNIYKNQTADMIEGGISGTIDLRTRKPFDASGRVLAVSAQASHGDIADKTTPGFNGLYSDRFDLSGGGELGVLFSYSNSELDFRSDGVEAGQHMLLADAAGSGQDRYAPINAGIRSTFTERDREGIDFTLQYANANDSFLGTFEYIRSDSTNEWLEHAFFSDDNGGLPTAGAVYDGESLISGTITNVANGLGPQTRRSANEVIVEEYSLNLAFNPTDRLAVSADIQFVDATTDQTDFSVFAGLMPQGGSGIDIGLTGLDSDVPVVEFGAPAGSAQSDEAYFSDPTNYFWRAAMDHHEISEGDELALRLDVEYDLDSGWAKSVEAGVRFAERDQTTRWSNFNWGNLSEAWNGGFALFDGTRDGTAFGSTAVDAFSFDDFHGGNAGGIAGLPSGVALFPSASVVGSQSAFEAFATPFGYTPAGGGGASGDDLFTPAEMNPTNEQNTAVYAKLNFEVDGARRLGGNVGLRWVEVETAVAGGTTFATLNSNTANFASPEELAFANGASFLGDSSSKTSKVLPSLNLKYELNDDVMLRFGYSGAIAFPDLGNLRFNYNISADTQNDANGNPDIIGWNQNSGNPFLDPMEADNFDLSVEWYFGDSNYVSAGLFYKDITNFFATDTAPTTVTNPATGQSAVVDINQPINIGSADLTGFEFSYQQFFDELPGFWSGFGMQFNYTYLDEDGAPNQNNRPVQADPNSPTRTSLPFDDLPLQGLSETTYNLVGIYQNDRFEGRLAYNWRDDYLLTIRQVNLGLPVFVDARGQLDGSAFFRINDEWQLGVQASNLLKDETVTSMQVDQAGTRVFRSSFVFDRRLAFVVRGKF